MYSHKSGGPRSCNDGVVTSGRQETHKAHSLRWTGRSETLLRTETDCSEHVIMNTLTWTRCFQCLVMNMAWICYSDDVNVKMCLRTRCPELVLNTWPWIREPQLTVLVFSFDKQICKMASIGESSTSEHCKLLLWINKLMLKIIFFK